MIAGETPRKKAQSKEASFLFRLDREGVHASAKGAPSAAVKTVDNDNSFDDDNVASTGRQNSP
jgi:hypothetical protein